MLYDQRLARQNGLSDRASTNLVNNRYFSRERWHTLTTLIIANDRSYLKDFLEAPWAPNTKGDRILRDFLFTDDFLFADPPPCR